MRVCRRLRMSREDTERIVDLVRSQTLFFKVKEMRESVLKRFLRKPHFADHLELHRAHTLSRQNSLVFYNFCRRWLYKHAQEPPASPLITGVDLIALGYRPGPLFKKILRTVEDYQLEGELRTRTDAIKYVMGAFPLREHH